MLIVHVVTVVTPDAAYGGPVRVAVNLLKELAKQGHSVLLVGGHRGYTSSCPPPTSLDGVPVLLFATHRIAPGTRFVGLLSPGLAVWLRRHASRIDVAHIHLSRDLIPMTAAQILDGRKTPLVVQTHGMVVESPHPIARLLDALFTRRLLRRASAVFFLTDAENGSLRGVARSAVNLVHLRNGVPLAATAVCSVEGETRLEVLFMARLHSRKRPDLFVRSATELATEFPGAYFTLIGPDEGMAAEVQHLIGQAGLHGRINWEGALAPQHTLERLRTASIYALPSVNEPFPMAALEAMSVGRPVIVTDSCGLADEVAESHAGLVVDPSQEAFTASLRALLADPILRASMGQNARNLAMSRFAMAPVISSVLDSYNRAVQEMADV